MYYLYAAIFLATMNYTSIKVLLPDIMATMNIELNWLTWVVNAYSLPLAVLVPVAGRIGDIFGSRRYFIAGVLGLGVGSLICTAAFDLPMLIGGRVIQALGAAFLIPNSITLLLKKVAVGDRGKVLGITGGISAIGAIVGPVFSGSLVNLISWRGSFALIAILTLIILIAAWLNTAWKEESKTITQEQNNSWQSFDLVGSALIMLAGTSLLLSMTLLPDWGWQNIWIQTGFGLFLVTLYLFYRVEKAVPSPLFAMELLKEPRFSLGLLVGFVEHLVMAGTLFVMPIYFDLVQGYSAAAIALFLTPAAAAVALTTPQGGRLSDQIGPGPPIVAGMLLRFVSFLMLARIAPDTGVIYIGFCLVLNGAGFGLATTPAFNTVLSTVDDERHGIASGVHNMIRFTGAAIGTTLGGIILYALIPETFTMVGSPIPGFREVLQLAAAACLPGVGAGLYLWVKKLKTG
jgi:EmrB/QacA subfamily drug resistance transporter